MKIRASLRRHLRGAPRLVAVLVLASTALLAGSSPALAATTATTDLSVEQQVADVLQTYPGSVQISRTDVQLAPGVEMSIVDPASARSTAAVAVPSSCWRGYLCFYEHADFGGNLFRVARCGETLLPSGWNGLRDKASSIYNNQYGGVISTFYNNHTFGGMQVVGRLSAGNYLQALNLNQALDGGTWNDKIDKVHVC